MFLGINSVISPRFILPYVILLSIYFFLTLNVLFFTFLFLSMLLLFQTSPIRALISPLCF
jgi:hypothetical protein